MSCDTLTSPYTQHTRVHGLVHIVEFARLVLPLLANAPECPNMTSYAFEQKNACQAVQTTSMTESSSSSCSSSKCQWLFQTHMTSLVRLSLLSRTVNPTQNTSCKHLRQSCDLLRYCEIELHKPLTRP